MNPFTKQQLYQVRNEIDINWLINEKLNIERQFKRIWRFQCPLCQQFNTATQKTTNLARCFSCQKNFNTIDLVIYTKKTDFVPSVQFLLLLLDNISSKRNNDSVFRSTVKNKEIKEMDKKMGLLAIQKIKRILNN